MQFKLVKQDSWYSLLIYDERGRIFERIVKFTTSKEFAEEFLAKRESQIKELKVLI